MYSHSTMIKIRQLTLIQYNYLVNRTYSDLANCLNTVFHKEIPKSCVAFSSQVSLVFNWNSCSVHLCVSWHGNFWSAQNSYFIRCSSVSVCLVSLHGWAQVVHLWQEYHRGECPLSESYPDAFGAVSSINGDVNFDHLVKMLLPVVSTVKFHFTFAISYIMIRHAGTV